MGLSWSLIVATLNREEVLIRSLRANVRQTRLPAQVIVVDSSANWQGTRDRVGREIAPEWPGVEWDYVGSDRRSLTHQRNLGLARCTSDVAFLLDDDSFMYHDCAERIMSVYDADLREEIGGVCAWLAEQPEGSPAPERRRNGLGSRLVRAAERLWWQDKLFIPYDGHFHQHDVGARGEDVIPVSLFHGCRMTFRTSAVRKVGGFEEMLIGTAYGEDCDFSYRISRNHAILAAPKARLHHEQVPVSRPKRELNTALILLNAIALYKVNNPRESGAAWIAYKFLLGRAALELLRDCARPRKWMPYTRGVFRAARFVPTVLSLDEKALREGYASIQEELRKLG